MIGQKRVVVTGLGVIAPNGTGKEAFWTSLRDGHSGIRKISFFDASDFPTRIAGEVRDFAPEVYLDKKRVRRMARFSQFAIACVSMAVEDAGLDEDQLRAHSPGLVLGISGTDIKIVEDQCRAFFERGLRGVSPFSSFMSLPNAAPCEVATYFHLNNFNLTVSTGCASGLDAVGAAYQAIRNGQARMVIAGGSDSPITPVMLGSLCSADIMTKRNEFPERASRPFDKQRDGGVLSEGAAIVVLEERSSALARGIRIYGELTGYGQSIESKEEAPGTGLERAIRKGLWEAGLDPREMNYISAHAPSDVLLDACETSVIKKVFGRNAYLIPVSSIKGHIGNPYSAAGVLQLISVVLAIQEGIIPPTLNYENPDPNCDLDYVPNVLRYNEIRNALVNSHGFGGANSALLVRRPV